MANGGIDSNEFFSALDALSKERRINKDVLFGAIEAALISAYKKNFGKRRWRIPSARCRWRKPVPYSLSTSWGIWSRCR